MFYTTLQLHRSVLLMMPFKLGCKNHHSTFASHPPAVVRFHNNYDTFNKTIAKQWLFFFHFLWPQDWSHCDIRQAIPFHETNLNQGLTLIISAFCILVYTLFGVWYTSKKAQFSEIIFFGSISSTYRCPCNRCPPECKHH